MFRLLGPPFATYKRNHRSLSLSIKSFFHHHEHQHLLSLFVLFHHSSLVDMEVMRCKIMESKEREAISDRHQKQTRIERERKIIYLSFGPCSMMMIEVQ